MAVFHTEGGVPWDFPPLAQLSPLKLCRAYCILGIIFPPQWHQVLYLLILKTMVLYETLYGIFFSGKKHSLVLVLEVLLYCHKFLA